MSTKDKGSKKPKTKTSGGKHYLAGRGRKGGKARGKRRTVKDFTSIKLMVGDQLVLGPDVLTPRRREEVRQVVEEGLPVEAVRQLQQELARMGVARPSAYVESIASRASRSRRPKLTPEEGEKLVRVASILVRALAVWEDEDGASDFLTAPHPELNGAAPIDRALSEIGARQVEDLLLKLDLGMPV